jgi:hypothetical protein
MEIRIKILLIVAAGIIVTGWSQSDLAQSQPTASGNIAVQIANARKANAALMRQYTWDSRTEVIEEGAVKDIRVEAVSYGPGGQLQRTVLSDQPVSQPMGFLGQIVAEKRKERLEVYLKGLRSLLEQYSLPTEANVLNFMNQATTTLPDMQGPFNLLHSMAGERRADGVAPVPSCAPEFRTCRWIVGDDPLVAAANDLVAFRRPDQQRGRPAGLHLARRAPHPGMSPGPRRWPLPAGVLVHDRTQPATPCSSIEPAIDCCPEITGLPFFTHLDAVVYSKA